MEERYLVTAVRLPYEERDVAHASPFMDTYEDVHPAEHDGQITTYSVDLDSEWADRFEHASNLVDLFRISDYGLGYHPAPDAPGEPLTPYLEDVRLPVATGDPDLSAAPLYRYWRTGKALDQGREGACCGFSATNFLNAAPLMGSYDDAYAQQLYRRAQQLDQWAGENYSGTSVDAACQALVERGLIEAYAWAQTLEEVRAWLLAKGGLMLGMSWYEGMYVPNAHGYIRPAGRKVGGHAIFCRGTNRYGDLRLFNSWGRDFGENGLCWLSKADAEWLWNQDAMYAAAAVQVKK